MVETVRGPVAAGDLGVSLLHEHVFKEVQKSPYRK